jgi:hypothetical protein
MLRSEGRLGLKDQTHSLTASAKRGQSGRVFMASTIGLFEIDVSRPRIHEDSELCCCSLKYG